MFDLAKVKILHLEPTSHCNAACPACNRYDSNGQLNPNVKITNLSLEKLQSVISEEFVANLDKMYMCGNHGDPAAGRYTMDIYRWFRSINSSITLGMNTNGAIRSKEWWDELGSMLSNPTDYVVFSIDGIEDTNHIYRRNVVWSKLMRNVEAFIAAGGRAHWDMLIFKHNEHQIEQAKLLAEELGFVNFRCKISRRERTWQDNLIEKPTSLLTNFHTKATDISCAALNESSVYIDVNGKIYPCCWLAIDAVNNRRNYDLNHIPSLSNATCERVCGITDRSNFEKQWI